MVASRALATLWLLVASSGFAAPDLPALSDPSAPLAPGGSVQQQAPTGRDPNTTSLFAATALGRGNAGFGMYLGFPLLGVRAGYGILDTVDVGLELDSFYGVMNELRAFVRWQLYRGRHWTWALVADGGKAFFAQTAATEGKGARWLTGRRNWNVVPGMIASYSSAAPLSARLFVDLRCHVAFDTEPFQSDPLGGIPPALQVSTNLPVRFGVEAPFSSRTSFLFAFGFDLHGRVEDSKLMPMVSIGVVTAL